MACNKINFVKLATNLAKNRLLTVDSLAKFLLADIDESVASKAMHEWLYNENGTVDEDLVIQILPMMLKRDPNFKGVDWNTQQQKPIDYLVSLLQSAADAIDTSEKNPDNPADSSTESASQDETPLPANDDENGGDEILVNPQIRSYTLDTDTDRVFGDFLLLENFRQRDFEAEMLLRMSYYKNGDRIYSLENNIELNKSIAKYKSELFKLLVDFINSKLTDSDKISDNELYDLDKSSNTYGLIKRKLFNQVLAKFDYLLKTGLINPSIISNSWDETVNSTSRFNEKRSNDYQIGEWEASCAYLNLKHFDETLKASKIDKLILIQDGDGIEPNLYNLSGSSIITKYTIGSDKSHLISSWNIGEYRNAVKENSRLSEMVIKSLQKYTYDVNGNSKRTIGTISTTEIATSWSRLVEAALALYNISADKGIYKNILKISDNPSLYIKLIFNEIFKFGNTDLRQGLINYGRTSGGFDLSDLGVLYSVYKSEIDSESLRIRSENNSLQQEKGISLGDYLKSDIIYGIIRKNNSVNYQVTVYEDGEYVIKNLAKSSVVFRNRMNFLKGKNEELAMMLPLNIRTILSRFGIERVPDPVNKGKYLTNELYITLGGKKMRLVLNSSGNEGNKGISLGTANATSRFHIIPPLDSDIFNLLLDKLGEDYYDDLKNNPYSDKIKLAIKNSDKFTNEEKESLIKDLKNVYDDLLSDNKFGSKNREKILNEESDMDEINELLEFMDTMLHGLDLRSEQGLLTLYYFTSRNGNTLRQIMSEATMIAYKMSLIADTPEEETLYKYVTSQDGVILLKAIEGKIFKIKDGKYVFSALSNSDWLEDFFEAKAVVDGNATRSVTKGRDGNNKANYVPASLSDHFRELLNDRKESVEKAYSIEQGLSTHPLETNILIENPDIVLGISRDSSAESMFGDTKTIKTLTPAELIYHGIIDNFFNNFVLNGTFSIIPTVYSDKTAFINFMVDGRKNIFNDKNLWQLTESEYQLLYEHSVKKYYLKQNEAILNKFRTLYNIPNATAVEINNLLKTKTKSDLEKDIRDFNRGKSDDLLIVISKDSEYRVTGGHLALNELSTYYNGSEFNLEKRFEKEKRKFVKMMIKNGINFIYDKKSPLYKLVHDSSVSPVIASIFESSWVSNGNLVLAKLNGKNIYSLAELDENLPEYYDAPTLDEKGKQIIENGIPKTHKEKTFQLNPLLLKYYYIDTIMSSNIKYSLVGNEISDPLKAGLNMDLDFGYIEDVNDPNYNKYLKKSDNTYKTIEDISNLRKLSEEDRRTLQTMDLATLGFIINGEDNSAFALRIRDNEYVKKMYDSLIYRCISTSEGSQYKRNVIVPASGIYYELNTLTGIGDNTRVAFMEDPLSEVWNYSGFRSDEEDALDGSALQCALQAIMENGSLNADAVGYRYKKPIWYYYDDKTGCSGLMKYAVHTIHNDVMRNSTRAKTDLNLMWKKMTNFRWDLEYPDLDLCNSVLTRKSGRLNFLKDVVSFCKNDDGERVGLFYEDSVTGTIYSIDNLERDYSGIYYTTELKIGISGEKDGSNIYVAHIYDTDGNEIKVRSYNGEKKDWFLERVRNLIYKNPQYHNIRSLYELHLALGGIYSVEKSGRNTWNPSESSNYATVAMMNNVMVLNSKYAGKPLSEIPKTQEAFNLPLKKFMVGYLALGTSNKRHTANINSVDILRSNDELIYSVISNKGHCILLDPTHEADEAELTEMSLVIASLDVGGKLHDVAKETYLGLGKLILDKLDLKEKIISEFLKNNISQERRQNLIEKLYDIVVRQFINNYTSRSSTDLANSIVSTIKKNFGKERLFQNEEFKLPMSDPNIFKQLVSSFISDVNSALKRKYSGIGDVMTPGFDLFLVYHLQDEFGNDEEYLFEDIYKKALPRLKLKIHEEYNIDDIIARATPYLKYWNRGEDKEHFSNAWFFTLDKDFKFNSNAISDERYGGHLGFEIVLHDDEQDTYEIHFKGDREHPFTDLQKATYFLAIRKFLLSRGAKKLVLTGSVSKGGFSGFNKLINYGFRLTGKFRPVLMKDTSVRNEVFDRWKIFLNPNSYITSIDNENDRKNELELWKTKTFRDVNLDLDVLAPELELDPNAIIDEEAVLLESLGRNLNEIRKNIVEQYLLEVQELTNEEGNKIYYKKVTDFEPCDAVTVTGANGEMINFDLDNIDEYFDFKEYLFFRREEMKNAVIGTAKEIYQRINNQTPPIEIPLDFIILNSKEIALKLGLNGSKWVNAIMSDDLSPRMNILMARNLRPQRISFKASDGNTYNMYDLDEVRKKHREGKRYKSRKNAEINEEVDKAIHDLVTKGIAHINGLTLLIDINSISNRAAEALMTDIHRSNFHLKSTSLLDLRHNFKGIFIDKEDNSNYDIIIKGRNSFGISFRSQEDVNPDLKKMSISEVVEHTDDGIFIYAKDKDSGNKTYKIGWYNPNTEYVVKRDAKLNYYLENSKGERIDIPENIEIINGKAYKKEYFINQYQGYGESENEFKSFRMFNFNSDVIYNYLQSLDPNTKVTPEEFCEYIGELLKDLSLYKKSTHIQLCNNIKSPQALGNYVAIINNLKRSGSNYKFWNESIKVADEYLREANAQEIYNLDILKKNGFEYRKALARTSLIQKDAIKASHELARYFIAARIPAQSLQSYMKMKCVGFLLGTDNLVIVSHWQTWLLGSDY